ncbi:hypothetical protein FGO68_gene6498 [Halteria grandinella]|uniref:Uncharacterized protein n=1 Tax=Halteria grandinella TaxID=5974 RepID=A0A8J8SVZ5_HALGN|nr:hypothetical protein FGO68_gene6498 [Halteria grandinella]
MLSARPTHYLSPYPQLFPHRTLQDPHPFPLSPAYAKFQYLQTALPTAIPLFQICYSDHGSYLGAIGWLVAAAFFAVVDAFCRRHGGRGGGGLVRHHGLQCWLLLHKRYLVYICFK